MARNKEFDVDQVLDAAIGVFREHGYAGTSATMLTAAMKIGRQSVYDTFGDKWQLYCASVNRYGDAERQAHLDALNAGPTSLDGLRRMMQRVVAEAHLPCLGVGSISEFGRSNDELVRIHEAQGRVLRKAIAAKVRQAKTEGDVARSLDPDQVSGFLMANLAGIRLAARGGANKAELQELGRLALQALR
ncbi:TetR/AcrR family transcriptional regulator [Cupriavidus pauculus]|uniref:TetR family transcriptional regulator n=1 Tax=Cupriavidus pauculus TaxID=82633 RepID=A0A2N5CDM5_9BURK|nr:TetR/AcrR family transcriptional regulator [Cupriavidus pauculus]PLQ00285.1 TetR family transcriptional regulator [Cupriavidus pauculus]